MSPGSSCVGSGSNGLTNRPETVCRYGPGAGGAGSAAMAPWYVRRMTPPAPPGPPPPSTAGRCPGRAGGLRGHEHRFAHPGPLDDEVDDGQREPCTRPGDEVVGEPVRVLLGVRRDEDLVGGEQGERVLD